MIEQPVLKTLRLRLRPLKLSDASAIQKAASARKIADTMISLPHPYPAGEAERYVARQLDERKTGRGQRILDRRKINLPVGKAF